MKTLTKNSKAILLSIVAVVVLLATVIAFTACNDGNTPSDNENDATSSITKYDASFDASINMGGNNVNFGDVVSSAYVTKDGGNYTLTVIFKQGNISVFGTSASVFVVNSLSAPTTAAGFADGTIGVYNTNGDLVTEGVTVTYSSGDNYAVDSAKKYVYYVQSASFPVEGLRDTYELTLYINSSMRGIQFAHTTYKAELKLDLESGETVDQIEGLGVDTFGTVPTYTEYAAQLTSVVPMGQDINFTANLLDGVYVAQRNGKYEITLLFKSGIVNMPFGNVMTGFLTSAESVDYNGNNVTPVFGYYNEDTLVTEGVVLTYTSGEDYVTVKGGSYYYVASMTFTVDKLEENYNLSLYVMSGNETAASSMQFPYTTKNGVVCTSELTIDLSEELQTVVSIADLLGVDTLGEVEEA